MRDFLLLWVPGFLAGWFAHCWRVERIKRKAFREMLASLEALDHYIEDGGELHGMMIERTQTPDGPITEVQPYVVRAEGGDE